MYAKRIDSGRIYCPERPYLIENGRIYTNPTEYQMRRAGYKPLVDRPCPAELEAAYTLYYEEDDAHIYRCYRGEEEIG
jgi:hypothetical protein